MAGREDNSIPVQPVAVGSDRQLCSGVRSVCSAVQVVESHFAAKILTVSQDKEINKNTNYLQLLQEDL